jgi:hypothetical protein
MKSTHRARWIAGNGLLLVILVSVPCSAGQKVHEQPKPAAGPGDNSITLGTTKERVDQLLGEPQIGWTINCLARSMYTYPDGSKVVFAEGRAISALPNGLAKGSPAEGLTVEHSGRQIFFEPIVISGVPVDGPTGDVKHQVEECFYMLPPFHGLEVVPQPLWIRPKLPCTLRQVDGATANCAKP